MDVLGQSWGLLEDGREQGEHHGYPSHGDAAETLSIISVSRASLDHATARSGCGSSKQLSEPQRWLSSAKEN